MTIIIGVVCSDGVVIASDSMASLNLGTTNFIGVNNSKTHVLKNKFVVACAGEDDLMTFFLNFLDSYLDLNITANNSDEFVANLVAGFINYSLNLYKDHPTSPVVLNGIQTSFQQQIINRISTNFVSLIGFDLSGGHYLYKINGSNFCKIRPDGIWHSIIGSGELVGLPTIQLIKKILNINYQPKVDAAVNLVYWTIDHAVNASSGGLGGEPQIAQLSYVEGTYKAEHITNIEAQEYINDMYNHIHTFTSATVSQIASNSEIYTLPVLENEATSGLQ